MTERMQRPSLDQLDRTEEPLMKIKFGYSHTFILPWSKGKEMMDLLSQAEPFYNGEVLQAGMDHNEPEFGMMSRSEYRNRKMAQLLKIDYAELVSKDRKIDDDNMPYPF